MASTPLVVPQAMPSAAIGYLIVVMLSYLFFGDKDTRWIAEICMLAFMAYIIGRRQWRRNDRTSRRSHSANG